MNTLQNCRIFSLFSREFLKTFIHIKIFKASTSQRLTINLNSKIEPINYISLPRNINIDGIEEADMDNSKKLCDNKPIIIAIIKVKETEGDIILLPSDSCSFIFHLKLSKKYFINFIFK